VSYRIQPTQVSDFWKYMCRRYGTKVVSKANAVEMQAVAGALAAMGIMDAKKFMEKYTTTVGNTIYVPFYPGNIETDLVAQVAICAHEHVHVRQFKGIDYAADYLLSSSKRALYEAEAYRATMEMFYPFIGTFPAASALAKGLKAYACTPEDIEVAKTYLEKAAAVIRKGGIITPESQVALAWLKKKGVVS